MKVSRLYIWGMLVDEECGNIKRLKMIEKKTFDKKFIVMKLCVYMITTIFKSSAATMMMQMMMTSQMRGGVLI